MRGVLLAAAFFASGVVSAQSQPAPSTLPPTPSATVTQPLITCCAIPALTVVDIEILSTLNSQANHIGEKFAIRLAHSIVVDGKELVPAGVLGSGDIVHAAKSRFGGKPGEMILAARYLEYNGARIPLRSLRAGSGQGKDNGDTATVVAIAVGGAVGGMLSMFITGGEVNVPAGTIMNAKVSAEITIPAATLGQQITKEGTSTP